MKTRGSDVEEGVRKQVEVQPKEVVAIWQVEAKLTEVGVRKTKRQLLWGIGYRRREGRDTR
jgi:hypothetical protein